MNNMKISFLSKDFKNPIVAASGTYGYGMEYDRFYDISLLGGISVKGLTREERQGNAAPRIAETPSGILNCVGLQNPGVEAFISEDMPFLKSKDTVIIANIAGSIEDDYIYMADRISQSQVDIIELNISCPNVKAGGIGFGVLPAGVENITKKVKEKCRNIPLVVKLTPNVSNIADNARAAEAGGADGVSLINTLTGMAVDIKTRKPILSNIIGGLSGPCVKPIALKMVRDVYKAVNIPIMGMGGITNYVDVVEFMLCGATIVQVGTANITNPFACKQIIDDLQEYLYKENINDIKTLVGGLK